MTITNSRYMTLAIVVFAVGALSGCAWSAAGLATTGAVLASQQLGELFRLLERREVIAPCC